VKAGAAEPVGESTKELSLKQTGQTEEEVRQIPSQTSSSSTATSQIVGGASSVLPAGVPPPTITATFREMLPKQGYLHCEDELTFVLCKPKLLPLKSFTMEKLEKIQKETVEKAKELMENSQLD